MKLPRDISGAELAEKLKTFGYRVTRQAGSHLRVTTEIQGQHHVSIPNHESLRVGTLAGIVSDVAEHFKLKKQVVINRLFG